MVEKYEQQSGYGCLLTVITVIIFLLFLLVDYLLNENWYLLWLTKKDNFFLGIKFLGGLYGILIIISFIYYFAIFPIGWKIRTYTALRNIKKIEQIITHQNYVIDKDSITDHLGLKKNEQIYVTPQS